MEPIAYKKDDKYVGLVPDHDESPLLNQSQLGRLFPYIQNLFKNVQLQIVLMPQAVIESSSNNPDIIDIRSECEKKLTERLIVRQYMGAGFPAIRHRVMIFEVLGNQMTVKYLPMSKDNTFESALCKLGEIYPEVKVEKSFEDWDGIKAGTNWYGFTPNEVGYADWLRDKKLPAVDVDQLMQFGFDLENSKFKGEPPLKFTFKCAVQVVLNHIETLKKKYPEAEHYSLLHSQGMQYDLLMMLTNIDNLHIDNMPEPPRYKWPVCSAGRNDQNYWLGAIIHLLYEQKQITEYGRKGCDWWVKL